MADGDNSNSTTRHQGITLMTGIIRHLKAQFPTLVDVTWPAAANANSPVKISLYNVYSSNYQQVDVVGDYNAVKDNGPTVVYLVDDILQRLGL